MPTNFADMTNDAGFRSTGSTRKIQAQAVIICDHHQVSGCADQMVQTWAMGFEDQGDTLKRGWVEDKAVRICLNPISGSASEHEHIAQGTTVAHGSPCHTALGMAQFRHTFHDTCV